MPKRFFPNEALLVAGNSWKKRCLEVQLEEEFENPNFPPVTNITQLPVAVLRNLYSCVTGKRRYGESRQVVNDCRKSVLEWFETVSEGGISPEVAQRIRDQFSPNHIKKLGIGVYLLDATVVPIDNFVRNEPVSGLVRTRAIEILQPIPDSSSANEMPLLDEPEEQPFIDGDEDQYDIGSDDEQIIDEVDKKEDVWEWEVENTAHQRQKTMLEVFRAWLGCPQTLGITEAAFSQLFLLFQLYKPTISAEGWKKFPITGKGLVYLPKKHFANVKFRNLRDYQKDTDKFPDIVVMKKPAIRRVRKIITANALLTTNHPALSALNRLAVVEKEDDESDGDDDDESVVSELCSSSDSDGDDVIHENDGNEADCEDNNENQKLIIESDEDECEVEEVAIDDDVDGVDVDGVDKQIQFDEANNKCVQEMAYFGVENVLIGKNPGLVDHRGFENVLKAMMVLNNTVLSDYFVNKCFDRFDKHKVCQKFSSSIHNFIVFPMRVGHSKNVILTYYIGFPMRIGHSQNDPYTFVIGFRCGSDTLKMIHIRMSSGFRCGSENSLYSV
jgi:hypothetical protein